MERTSSRRDKENRKNHKGSKRISVIGFVMGIVFFSVFSIVHADLPWCSDECPWGGGQCMCQSTMQGAVCDLIHCIDINNDGCTEWDWNNPTRCPYDCEQTGDFYAECTYAPSPCIDICEIGESECVGPYDAYLGTKQSKYHVCVDIDNDGCGEWDVEVIDCSSTWCEQTGSTAGCYYEAEPECQDECVMPQMKCIYVGGNDYRDPCGQYDNDGCLEWASSSCGGECLTYDMDYCPFGCKEPQSLHAVCNIKPEECVSTCRDGESVCGGSGYDIFSCAYNSVDNCWQYYDDIGNAYDVTHCDWGCLNLGNGTAECLGSIRRYDANSSISLTASNDNPSGIVVWGQYIYVTNDDTSVYRYYLNGSYKDVVFTLPGGVQAHGIETDGRYFWIADFAGDKIYEYFFQNRSSTGNTFEQEGIAGYGGLALYGDNLYLIEYVNPLLNASGNIWEFSTTMKNYTENKYYVGDILTWPMGLTTDGEYWYIIERCDPASFCQPQNLSRNGVYRFDMNFDFVDYFIHIDDGAIGRLDYYKNQLYLTFNAGWWGAESLIHHIEIFDIFETYEFNKCLPNSKKCSDASLIGEKKIRPYLMYCGDEDGDGYYEWPEMTGTGIAEYCEYGCWFNESIGDVECRSDYYYETCEDIDWECIPETKGCKNGWQWECEENPTGSNCYTEIRKVLCDNGCNAEGTACKACGDECDNGESKCFPNGIGGIDYETQQSIWYGIPMVVNCTYDWNQKCWRYTVKEMERCPYSCYDQFNTTSNLTKGFCWTAEEIEREYWLLNYTSSLKSVRADIATYLTMIFPTKTYQYLFSISFSLIIAGYAGYRGKSMKIGAFLLLGFTLLFSLGGWLPIEITVFLAVGCGFWAMQKLFLKRGD